MMILFSNDCPKCKILESRLNSKNIEFIKNDNFEELIEKGFNSAPILKIENKYLTYLEAINWIKEYGKKI